MKKLLMAGAFALALTYSAQAGVGQNYVVSFYANAIEPLEEIFEMRGCKSGYTASCVLELQRFQILIKSARLWMNANPAPSCLNKSETRTKQSLMQIEYSAERALAGFRDFLADDIRAAQRDLARGLEMFNSVPPIMKSELLSC